MNQTTDPTPAMALCCVPHDTPCDTAADKKDGLVIRLDVIDLAEPDDDY